MKLQYFQKKPDVCQISIVILIQNALQKYNDSCTILNNVCLYLKGDRGEPGPPGPSTPLIPAERLVKGEAGEPGGVGGPGFTGPRGMRSGQTV